MHEDQTWVWFFSGTYMHYQTHDSKELAGRKTSRMDISGSDSVENGVNLLDREIVVTASEPCSRFMDRDAKLFVKRVIKRDAVIWGVVAIYEIAKGGSIKVVFCVIESRSMKSKRAHNQRRKDEGKVMPRKMVKV